MLLLDGVVLALLLAFVVLGAVRGLVRDVVALVGIVAGFWLAWRYGPAVRGWLEPLVRDGRWRWFLGYAVTFFGVVIAAGIVGALLGRFLHQTPLGWLDRLLGAALGMARGLVVTWAVMAITLMVRPDGRERVDSSRLARAIMEAGERITGTYRSGPAEQKPPRPSRPTARGDYVFRLEDGQSPAGICTCRPDGCRDALDSRAKESRIVPGKCMCNCRKAIRENSCRDGWTAAGRFGNT